VGTARIAPQEPEPSSGRIIVLEVTSHRKFNLVTEKEVNGAVYNVDVLVGKLTAAVNGQIQMFTWTDNSVPLPEDADPNIKRSFRFRKSLVSHCEFAGNIVATHIRAVMPYGKGKSKGTEEDDGMADEGEESKSGSDDFPKVIVGDMMSSASLLRYKPEDQRLELASHDIIPTWVTALEPVSPNLFLVADSQQNIIALSPSVTTGNANASVNTLLPCCEFHLGDSINCIRPGSLVVRNSSSPARQSASTTISVSESTISSSSSIALDVQSSERNAAEAFCVPIKTFIWGTVGGAVGVLAQMTNEQFTFFSALERNLKKVIKGLGGLDHDKWRELKSDCREGPARRVVDGDLIESFLDLPPEKMVEAASGLGLPVETIAKRVEAIQKATH